MGAGVTTAASGAERQWNNPLGGDFATDSNWLDGISPSSGDDALFNLGSAQPYTIAVNNAGTPSAISRLIVRNDRLRIDLAFNDQTWLWNSSPFTPSTVGDALIGPAELTIGCVGSNGGSLRGGALDVGSHVLGGGTLNLVDNVLASFDTDPVSAVRVGIAGKGVLNVSSGASLKTNNLQVANQSEGVLNISDATVEASKMSLGTGGGRGTVVVNPGGRAPTYHRDFDQRGEFHDEAGGTAGDWRRNNRRQCVRKRKRHVGRHARYEAD